MKRFIKSAEEVTIEDTFNDKMSKLKDDFSYVIDGINKLFNEGKVDNALSEADNLQNSVSGCIEAVAAVIAEEASEEVQE